MSLHAFTILHVIICFVELAAGAVVVLRLMEGRQSRLTGLFLVSAALTAITGFLFPFHGVTPAIKVGVLSLLVTLLAALALYSFKLRGGWRRTYAISAVIVLYFDAFVAVVQAFEKIGSLHRLAPTGKEAPFAVVQGLLLVLFVIAGFVATKRFRA
jgi:hypothetical protein